MATFFEIRPTVRQDKKKVQPGGKVCEGLFGAVQLHTCCSMIGKHVGPSYADGC